MSEDITTDILKEFAQTVRNNGAVPVFIYLPDRKEMVNFQAGMTKEEQYLAEFCSANKVSAFFLRPYFLPVSLSSISLGLADHWSPVAHRLTAVALAGYFVKEGLIPRAAVSRAALEK